MAKKPLPEGAAPENQPPSGRPGISATRAEVLDELHRIVDSKEFSGSERGRMLLRYLVENALNGGLDRLKERTIGVEVFHRAASYDTGQDAIVRVSVNSVRKRLAGYYERVDVDGVRPGLRIGLAPGSYTPEFIVSAPLVPLVARQETLPAQSPPPGDRSRRYLAIIAVLALSVLVLAIQVWRLSRQPAARERITVMPWAAMTKYSEVRIVLTDANFTFYKYHQRRGLSLPEYERQDWLSELKTKEPALTPLSGIPYTSVASAVTAVRLGSLLEKSAVRVLVQSARTLQLRDFKEDRPIVLLGSAPSNPWAALFDDRMNFVIDVDNANGVQYYRNVSPRPGEPTIYLPAREGQTAGISYGVVGLLPNLAGRAPVLLIAGSNTEATEAAGELVADIPRLTEELRRNGIDPAGSVQRMELLIKVICPDQAPSRSEVIAVRVTR